MPACTAGPGPTYALLLHQFDKNAPLAPWVKIMAQAEMTCRILNTWWGSRSREHSTMCAHCNSAVHNLTTEQNYILANLRPHLGGK